MPFRHPDHNRLETFSDAVFAFAATLLVVSLEVPETFAGLRHVLLGFFPFAISFGALVLIWKVHYNFFRRTTSRDNVVIALNMVLLFTVLYFVYPLKFMTRGSLGMIEGLRMTSAELTELFVFYGAGFCMLFLSVAGLYAWAAKREPDGRSELAFYARHFSLFVLVGLISILLAELQIGLRVGLAGFAYALLGPLCYLHGRLWGPGEPPATRA